MKLLRYGPVGGERPGVLDPSGRVRSLAGVIDDLAGDVLSDAGIERLRGLDLATLPPVAVDRLGPPVGRVGKVVCIGRNYAEHAAEVGATPQAEPMLFMKATTSLCGPDDDIQVPRGGSKTDVEVELGVVIGARARYVEAARALDCVAGYCVFNDVSERAFQKERGGQFVKGKSHDTFGPMGPWLVTRDEVPDPQGLSLWLDVDGVRRQHASTGDMLVGVADLVAYISGFMTLEPGDLIATGTPAGVGAAMEPPAFLRVGQIVSFGIDGLGEQSHRMVRA